MSPRGACWTLLILIACDGDPAAPTGGSGGASSASTSTSPTSTSTSAAAGGGGTGGAPPRCSVDDGSPEHIVAISIGDKTSVALSSHGRVACWGYTEYGQCGPAGTGFFHIEPRWIPGLDCIKQVDTSFVGFALKDDGGALGWGTEFQEELGDGPGTSGPFASLVNVLLPGPATAMTSQTQGGQAHVGDQTFIWGRVWPDEPLALPTLWELPAGASGTRGGGTVCELDTAGSARCRGANSWGEVGDGSLEARNDLVDLATSARFSSLHPVLTFSCGITLESEVYCWGDNGNAALGIGVVPPVTAPIEERAVPVPTRLAGLEGITMIDTAEAGGCALDGEGTVFCWGRNIWARFAPDDVDYLPEPQAIDDLSPAQSIAVGDYHVCVVRLDGTLWCRGERTVRGEDVDTLEATQVPFDFGAEP